MDDGEQNSSGSLLRRIDAAFDAANGAKTTQGTFSDDVIAPPTVRRRRGDPALSNPVAKPSNPGAGGFLAPSPPAGGGFLLEDGDASPESDLDIAPPQSADADRIPLALLPSALQILDLPPADPEIMEIFRNAAGSTGGSGVTRDDFRAVCRVMLLNQDDNDDNDDEEQEHIRVSPQENGDTRRRRTRKPSSSEMDEDIEERELTAEDDSEEDNYVKESSSEDEEYAPSRGKQSTTAKGKVSARPTKATSTRKRKRGSSSQEEEMSTLTRRQQAACREAFGLFFPDIDERDLDSQRIAIKDISRVSAVLRIKLTADEVLGSLHYH